MNNLFKCHPNANSSAEAALIGDTSTNSMKAKI